MHFNFNETTTYCVFATAIHMTISSDNHFCIARKLFSHVIPQYMKLQITQTTEKEHKMENRVNSEYPLPHLCQPLMNLARMV